MNVARLADYIRLYDVDLDHSFVAMQGEEMLGVAMLGVRHQRAWITRLGVVPTTRRHGAGKMLVKSLIDAADSLSSHLIMLEVIKNNAPAHQLFLKLGFRETGELWFCAARRAPHRPTQWWQMLQRLDRTDSLVLVGHDRGMQPGRISPNR